MQNTPLVSIIIPIYNVAPYLRECLDSVINQTYSNLDIILVDDESTDDSLSIALEYQQKDSRIFVVSKLNAMQGSARNVGLELIKGTPLRSFFEENIIQDLTSLTKINSFDKTTKVVKKDEILNSFTKISSRYIKMNFEKIEDLIIQELPDRIIHFLDSDDYFTLDCIHTCVHHMIEKNLDIFGYKNLVFNEKKKIFLEDNWFLFKDIPQKYYNSGIAFLSENNLLSFPFIWQGATITSPINSFNLRFLSNIYHQDQDFGKILTSLAKNLFFVKDSIGVIYRIRPHSTMTGIEEQCFPNVLSKQLSPLKTYFSTYPQLNKYFRLHSFTKIGINIYNFYKEQSLLDPAFKKYDSFFKKTLASYLEEVNFDISEVDPLNITQLRLEQIDQEFWNFYLSDKITSLSHSIHSLQHKISHYDNHFNHYTKMLDSYNALILSYEGKFKNLRRKCRRLTRAMAITMLFLLIIIFCVVFILIT